MFIGENWQAQFQLASLAPLELRLAFHNHCKAVLDVAILVDIYVAQGYFGKIL